LNVSVIIPTLNESGILAQTLERVGRLQPYEILIGDGGSDDATLEIARENGIRCIASERGRGAQMNSAAREATGDLFLFLHADSHLDTEAFTKMQTTMQDQGLVGGAFSLHIDSDKPSLCRISRMATWRSRTLNLVYGDQGIFVRAEVFRALNGFAPLPICEDLDFFQRLSRNGKTVVLKETIATSARRWDAEGVPFTTARNVLIAALFLMGISPRLLSKWYPPQR